ncbi:hypothetical protein [Serinicoccus marinus]|uniref:hypothetical protein n=1 Tax=Serinicoccus marinus TaxID=247333 RepID=UPI0003B31243|nr:hypothetical protein [Serinicoccus marinus]
MPPPTPPRRTRVAVVALVLLAAVAVLAWRPVVGWAERAAAPCSVVVAGERVPLDREQAQAATATAAGDGDVADPAGAGIPEGVVEAVRGARESTALTCRASAPDVVAQELTADGLTPRAQTVLEEARRSFPDLPTGGFAPGGVDSGHGPESTHYDGRAVDVFVRPVSEANRDRGWILAQWLVAHAEELSVQYVIFDDHYWGVRESVRGWQDYRVPGGSQDPVLRHLDHVHVDVLRGE